MHGRAAEQSTGAPAPAIEASEILRDVERVNVHEAVCRTAVGELAEVLCRQKAHQRLGFVRLSDYAREQLGLSAREVESLAQVTTQLRRLPAIAAVFARGALSWTQVRVLAVVATPEDEAAWLARAQACSGAELAALVRRGSLAVATEGVRSGAGPGRQHVEAVLDEALERADGEPAVRFQLRCPPRVRGLFYDTVELARRMAGEVLGMAEAAEAIAAEALSGAPRSVAGLETSDSLASPPHHSYAPVAPRPVGAPAPQAPLLPEVRALAAGAATVSAVELDARLRVAVRALRAVDWQIGSLLDAVRRRRLHRLVGFRVLADYVRDRVGIAPRTARALMAAERVSSHCTVLRQAYRDGELTRLQVLTIAPVVVGAPGAVGAAWVARARRVTLRRLGDEVGWVLARRDAGLPTPLHPPPLDARLQHETEWHIGADAAARDDGMMLSPTAAAPRCNAPPMAGAAHREFVEATITFTAPASIVALFHAALSAFATARPELAWRRCARMLAHVRDTWKAHPRHRDPIFERDGWQCRVPACSGRRHLHDHHVRFRSRGGDNRRTNRITVCAWHHLRAIHVGLVRGWGTAPDAIRWQLGLDGSSSWALLDFLGDRYLDREEVLADRREHKRVIAARLTSWMSSANALDSATASASA